MINIKISIPEGQKSILLRQTPNSDGLWKGCQFFINKEIDHYDWWVVLHHTGLSENETIICDPNHVLYVSLEPREFVGNVNLKFHKQFSTIVTPDSSIVHPGIINKSFHTWWAGMRVRHQNNYHTILPDGIISYDDFASRIYPKKKDRLSVITSKKNFLLGHKRRLEFINRLQLHPVSNNIDIFGDGFIPIYDKLDAIIDYKYHLVIENDKLDHYWTEKLADSFLAKSMPFYYGCGNINEYFSPKSMIQIDIDNPEKAIDLIVQALDSGLYDSSINEIEESRNLILNKYNIFNQLSIICNKKAKKYERIMLHPNRYFNDKWFSNNIKNMFYKLPLEFQLHLRRLK